ncbi:hypothetical protein E2562_013645 [Oryza meyeriana var. granulata]|uniref:Uncharacterized protein n=1 Tax=Oryza meyeriana var. granulata TaxID=110450 RepID=A0A6G1BJN2_9ORYZ|nr:hypothetical protein E2562_013645 [Oryza meyeriana var. granulata]
MSKCSERKKARQRRARLQSCGTRRPASGAAPDGGAAASGCRQRHCARRWLRDAQRTAEALRPLSGGGNGAGCCAS